MTWGAVETTLDRSRTGDRSLVVGVRVGEEARYWQRGLLPDGAATLQFLGLFRLDAGSALARAAAETARTRYEVNRMLGVGLGWVVLPGGRGPRRARLPHDVLMHDGGTGGYRSFAAVAPATGTAVVVLSGRARGVSGLGLRLVRAVV